MHVYSKGDAWGRLESAAGSGEEGPQLGKVLGVLVAQVGAHMKWLRWFVVRHSDLHAFRCGISVMDEQRKYFAVLSVNSAIRSA